MYRSTFEYVRGKVDMSFVVDNLPLNIFLTTDPETNVGILSVIYRNEDDLLVVLEAIISLLRKDLDPIDVKALASNLFELIRSYKSNNASMKEFNRRVLA